MHDRNFPELYLFLKVTNSSVGTQVVFYPGHNFLPSFH